MFTLQFRKCKTKFITVLEIHEYSVLNIKTKETPIFYQMRQRLSLGLISPKNYVVNTDNQDGD